MLRKIAVFSCVALAASTIATAAWGAAPPPPTGTLSCGATGSAILKPGIPGHTQPASLKNISVKVTKASVNTCTNAGVSGGKLPIDGGQIGFTGVVPPGATCDTLLTAPPNITKPKLTVKLTGTNPKNGKPSTVATIKPINVQFAVAGAGFAITGTIPQNKKGNAPFGGETFESQLNADNITDALACITGPVPLTHLDFSTGGGSGISIHP